MNRTTNILGFAFLALAVTMAATITLRNAPPAARTSAPAARSDLGAKARDSASATVLQAAPSASKSAARAAAGDALRVTLPEEWLATLATDERQEWQARAAAVERKAAEQLDRLTGQLDLSLAQRGKVFPALVRAAPGYDPAMMIGGDPGRSAGGLTPAEEIHALLDQEQQAAVEDEEVNRQLWWQDLIDKLEADLTRETGGNPAGDRLPPAAPETPDGDRVAPEARDDGNLFDQLNP